jgi:hypothetical protein
MRMIYQLKPTGASVGPRSGSEVNGGSVRRAKRERVGFASKHLIAKAEAQRRRFTSDVVSDAVSDVVRR